MYMNRLSIQHIGSPLQNLRLFLKTTTIYSSKIRKIFYNIWVDRAQYMNTRIGRAELDTYLIMSAPSDGSDNKIPSPDPTMSQETERPY
jgi:hypothetical protein